MTWHNESRRHSLASKGIKTNPIIIKMVASKDWKDTWSGREMVRAANESKKINGKIAEVSGSMGTDSDALYVFKGISKPTLEELDEDYGFAMDNIKAQNLRELRSKLQKEMDDM